VRRAFTLLEAVIALAILASAIMACLQVRAQMVAGAQRQREVQRADRAEEALFQMLVNNALPPARRDAERGTFVWEGEYLGRPYRIERFPMAVRNPALGKVSYPVSAQVTVFRYAMTYADRESEIVWHR
jgi:prepilin-type N-terminal cleavage/methylation domain-containing protein